MSKSLGNVVDPVEVISEYGTDALRFTLATGAPAPPMSCLCYANKASVHILCAVKNTSACVVEGLASKETLLLLPTFASYVGILAAFQQDRFEYSSTIPLVQSWTSFC